MGGLTAFLIRRLTDNPWDGGGGYDIKQVEKWTLDQIWMRLCDADILAFGTGKKKNVQPSEIEADKEGLIKGRASDGTPIRAKVTGKSLARRLMEEAAKNREAEEQKAAWRQLREERRQRKKRRRGKG